MRCRDASRAIAAPSGAITPAELEAHLAACPRCARQAEAAARLDRLWEATRPAPPSPSAWDAAWARIDRDLAEPETAARTLPILPGRPRRRRPIRLVVGLAAAAAVAAGLLVVLAPPDPDPPTVAQPADPIERTFVVLAGHTMLYHVDSGEEQLIQVGPASPDGDFTMLPRSEPGIDYFALFGWFEAMPETMASADSPSASQADALPSPFDPLPH